MLHVNKRQNFAGICGVTSENSTIEVGAQDAASMVIMTTQTDITDINR